MRIPSSTYAPATNFTIHVQIGTGGVVNNWNILNTSASGAFRLIKAEPSEPVILLFDDIESEKMGWTYDGLWHVTEHRNSSPTHSWYYGIEGVWNYDTGDSNHGNLTSPAIDLTNVEQAYLVFNYWYETESTGAGGGAEGEFDQRWVQISIDGSEFEPLEQLCCDEMKVWHTKVINLSDYVGHVIKIRFYFDTIDELYNEFEGWYVDDIAVIVSQLSIPQDSEYMWTDLNESLRTITTEGLTYETGLLGKSYIPKEIEPNKVYPVYILLSRNPEVSTLATVGWSFCVAPAFDIDVINKKFDLYLHFSTGPHFSDKFFERWMKHWFLWGNDKVKISYKIDEKLYNISLTELKPGEWNIYKIEVKAETPEIVDVAEPLKFSVESDLGTLGEGFWWQWNDNLGIWVEGKYDTFLVGVHQREFNRIKICLGPSIVLGVPTELWLHFGIGFGGDEEDWDEEIRHRYLTIIPLAMAEKPSECDWVRIDWFEVKVGNDGYVKHLEKHENGYLNATATSDEREAEFTILGEKVYSVTVSGTFKSDYGSQTVNATLYYLGNKNIKRGDSIEGYVKLVTLLSREPEVFISALEDCYWIIPLPLLDASIDKETVVKGGKITITGTTTVDYVYVFASEAGVFQGVTENPNETLYFTYTVDMDIPVYNGEFSKTLNVLTEGVNAGTYKLYVYAPSEPFKINKTKDPVVEFTITVIAAELAKTVTVESKTVNPGDTFTINVTLSNTPEAGVGAYGFNITFDPTVVQVKEVTNLPGIGVPNWDNETGWVKLGGAVYPAGGDGIYGTITFEAVGTSGTSTNLDLAVEDLKDGNNNPITYTVTDGSISIEACAKGDVDGDGYVLPSDALAVLRIYAGVDSPEDYPCSADVDGDGKILPSDALVILRIYAGVE